MTWGLAGIIVLAVALILGIVYVAGLPPKDDDTDDWWNYR